MWPGALEVARCSQGIKKMPNPTPCKPSIKFHLNGVQTLSKKSSCCRKVLINGDYHVDLVISVEETFLAPGHVLGIKVQIRILFQDQLTVLYQ